MSADAGLRKSLAFVLVAEGFTTIDHVDLSSACAASTLAACSCAIVDEIEPGNAGDFTGLPPMPVIVLHDGEMPAGQGGSIRYIAKPILGPKLTDVVRELLIPPGGPPALLSKTPKTSTRI